MIDDWLMLKFIGFEHIKQWLTESYILAYITVDIIADNRFL